MKKRRLVQVICALLYNCHFTGFYEGRIYQGSGKGLCVPGLNCYSCPGAVGACPLGSLQTALVSYKYKAPYYVLGVLLLFGVLLGRVICGFLCPFGLLQELLYKIPSPKLKKGRWTKRLSYLKYVLLAVFVVAVPLLFAVPGFCKYICPAGTLTGGIPLVLLRKELRTLAGGLFTWKVCLLVVIVGATVFCFRSFCRFLCPLGAFYGLFHKVSVFGVRVDEGSCSHCQACVRSCMLDVKEVGDAECVQCGACREVCKSCAISFGVKNGKGKEGQRKGTEQKGAEE